MFMNKVLFPTDFRVLDDTKLNPGKRKTQKQGQTQQQQEEQEQEHKNTRTRKQEQEQGQHVQNTCNVNAFGFPPLWQRWKMIV